MKKEIIIEGMMCSHCEKSVKESLENISEINEIEVNADKDMAKIQSESLIKDEDIKSAVKEAGYKVKSIKTL